MNQFPKGLKGRSDQTFIGLLFVFIVFLILGNTYAAEGSAFHFSSFTLSVWGKYLCYGVLAISLNMLWG
jgi:urea transport system permease protein